MMTRTRMTNESLDILRTKIVDLCRQHRPLSVRQLFYLLVTSGCIDKTENAYKQVIRLSGELRQRGELPFSWIRDDSRRRMSISKHKSPAHALRDMADSYSFDYQSLQPVRVEVWCEKETLSGVLWPICARYGIDLLPCKGMPSLTYRHEAAMAANADGRPYQVLYIGDSDPTGELIDPTINAFMGEYLRVEWLGIKRIAVTDEQRDEMGLPTRPAKESGIRAGRHADIGCVEVEAIPPDVLRQILAESIESHMDKDALERAKLEEQAHLETVSEIISNLGSEGLEEAENRQEKLEIVLYAYAPETDELDPLDRSDARYKAFFGSILPKSDEMQNLGYDKWYNLIIDGKCLLQACRINGQADAVQLLVRFPVQTK